MTLIETLIATGILLFGFVATASLFTYSAGTNLINQQSTAASALLSEKMEQLRQAADAAGGFDYVTIGNATYRRSWEVTGAGPRTITVVVFAQKAGITGRPMELIRACTIVSNSFQ